MVKSDPLFKENITAQTTIITFVKDPCLRKTARKQSAFLNRPITICTDFNYNQAKIMYNYTQDGDHSKQQQKHQ